MVRIIATRRLGRYDADPRWVQLRANLIGIWGDALVERNGWKSGNQVEIVVGDDDIVSDPVISMLRTRVDRYNRDQVYLTWKWDGTYGTGRRRPLALKQCPTCEKPSREARIRRDIQNGHYLRKGQRQLG